MLLAAAPVVLLAFALVYGHAHRTLTPQDLIVPGGLLAAFFAAHLAARRFARGADPLLLPLAALLSGIGLAVLTRLDPSLASAQVLWVLTGVALMTVTLAAVPSLEVLARYKYTIAIAGAVLLLMPAFVGREVNGARLWIRMGGLSFQPAEIAKLLLVLFFAAYLSQNREVLSVSTRRVLGLWVPPARHLGPLVAMWALSLVVLVALKDLGSSMLFFGLFLVMVHAATGRPAYTLAGLALFAAGAAVAYQLFGHVRVRVETWLDPFADVTGRGYQLAQSLFALGAGGMAGVGVGRGFPQRIPFVETDFIFAAFAEELGLLGGAAVVVAYLVLCLRGLATAVRARSDMAALTAVGLVAAFGLQVFVIVGGVTRLIPLTGITLPFVSYGGSSVVSNFILLALLMRAGDPVLAPIAPDAGLTGELGRGALSRRARQVAILLASLFVALVVNLTYVQAVAAPALAAHPANTRSVAEQASRPRGAIVTADDVVLARSVPDGALFAREYPEGAFAAHVVGYSSPRYGRAGIEAAADDALSSRRAFSTLGDMVGAAAGLPVPGNDVILTIDSRIQREAEAALSGRRGAVVAVDPRDGRVLAMASAPDFDPGDVDGGWDALAATAGAPLVDRAAGALYPPGSTYKTLTLAGALAAGVASPDTTYTGPARMEIGNAPVTNYGGKGYGTLDLRTAFARSVNTVFGQLAVELGPERLVRASEAFGVGEGLPLETPSRASLMPDPSEMTVWETAWAGIGQPVGEHPSPPGPQVTVAQMALVAAAVANDGIIMRPHLVAAVRDPAGVELSVTRPREWRRALDPATAATVRELMVGVVERGSGTNARIAGVRVAGKTGTAEVGKAATTHAWFMALAPADEPRVAIAVVLENAGAGGRDAAPAARRVIEAALGAR